MFKRIFLLSLFIIIFPVMVFAHTGLKESNPKDGETLTQELKEITLTFNTAIGPTSFFELKNDKNEIIPVELQVNGEILRGTINTLPNGQYTVNWKIAGKDGHIIDGNLSFTVEVEASAAPETPSEQVPLPEDREQPESNVGDAKKDDMNRSSVNGIVWGGIIAVIVAAVIILFRRKK